ncbi:family 43 glycosylhydrolase [Lutibacter sp. A80]|uniref:family 43 glycosylhydrolase n=1 Tax=Lutibacter sp. A80 TaxID=2918453 RepID=UPI001F06AA9A|nr:family 43 glycosylhydrolase [Lutibacter sp. A80]UMB59192.1 family 43 glycosylhydrolase [Lutibacter sp. A80]
MKIFVVIISMLFVGVNSSFSQSNLKSVKATYSPIEALGPEEGIKRGDPSDIIKVGSLYYVWYWKVGENVRWATWYATSPDGFTWTEKGEALPPGKEGSWDDEGCFTPGILIANDKYYLFYSGVNNPYKTKDLEKSKTRIGIAFSNSPDGPWVKLSTNPILIPSTDKTKFDSHRIDDASIIVRDGKYWLYYKGRQWGKSPRETKMGVAIANRPEGPYIKYKNNPVVKGGHEVLVWPQGKGVATMIGKEGTEDVRKSIMYAKDGLNFKKTHNFTNKNVPWAPGAFRPEAFTNSKKGKLIEWGIQRVKKDGIEYLERFDLKEVNKTKQ